MVPIPLENARGTNFDNISHFVFFILDLIQKGAKAKDPNPDVSKISTDHMEPKLDEKEWYTPENRTFFKTLVGIWQTESNESQQPLI